MRGDSSISPKYLHIWKKYRPVILKLMIDAQEGGPQQYTLSKHEFLDISPKQKGGYSFVLRTFQGKALNKIKDSVLAEELLLILNQSGKASELVETSIFEFAMDKNFVLHVSHEEAEEEVLEE